MRSRTAKWFEVTVRYDRQAEDGAMKKVNEVYVVDALTFGEAEETVTEDTATLSSGEFEVKKINPATYHEIFFSDAAADDRWYKAKLMFIVLDEEKQKEKRSAVTYLVQAASVGGALKNIQEAMSTTVSDYVIANISETTIMDVLEHKAE